MTDYKQTRDVSGRVTSQYGQMLQNLSDDDDLVKQALAELGDVVRCRCKAAYTGRGMHDPDCECDSAEAVKVVANRINLLEDKLKDLDEAYDSIIHALRFEALRTDDAEAKLVKAVEVLTELNTVAKRAIRLSQEHDSFRLYGMEPMWQATAQATATLAAIQEKENK